MFVTTLRASPSPRNACREPPSIGVRISGAEVPALMKSVLSGLLNEHAQTQEEALKQQNERIDRIATEVREAMARFESRRDHERRSPEGGFQFEDAVVDFASAALLGEGRLTFVPEARDRIIELCACQPFLIPPHTTTCSPACEFFIARDRTG